MATIKYYKNNELCYANRGRYNSISSFTASNEEVQKSVLLGDGANTSIKTAVANICNYVTIDGTRWFVMGYTYLNGGQVEMYLQRDVIGEFGIDGCFGKIERGYTNTFIKNRKELNLNQRLVNRIPLKQTSNNTKYGNYYVNNHEKEAWGILYFSKPTGSSTSINIPQLNYTPQISDFPYIQNNSAFYTKELEYSSYIKFNVRYPEKTNLVFREYVIDVKNKRLVSYNQISEVDDFFAFTTEEKAISSVSTLLTYIDTNGDISVNDGGFTSPDKYNITNIEEDYDNAIIFDSTQNKYFKYTVTEENISRYGNYYNLTYIIQYAINNSSGNGLFIQKFGDGGISAKSQSRYVRKKYKCVEVTDNIIQGTISISATSLFVDEPYFICVIPLYDVSIQKTSLDTITVDRNVAFSVFNNIILQTSGENAVLVDAQIYPYCPPLSDINCEFEDSQTHEKVPIYNILNSSYDTVISKTLSLSSTIKEEYIERELSIITPANTSKFNFNFYDYYNDGSTITINIKTALKPFNIVSSAVIVPNSTSLKGMTYESDLRGATSSGSEFECSLASNAYETYLRQNSNYQQMFELDKQELAYNHKIERQNEITQAIVNTVSATAMGAIGGAALAGGGKTGAIGASVGGVAAGALVGTFMGIQTSINEKARRYEEELQQQRFDLDIGTIKNLPNSINRISSFNEIVMRDFYYVIEEYECSEEEKNIVKAYIDNYGYQIGVFDYFSNYKQNGWFLRGSIIKSNFIPVLHNVAKTDLLGGIYMYE